MNRPAILHAARERRHRHARRQRFPQWLSYAPTRPVGRRREAPDSAWMDAAAVAWSIAGLLAVYALAGGMR